MTPTYITNKELLLKLSNVELAKILAAYCGDGHSCSRCPFYNHRKWASVCPGCGGVLEWTSWLDDEIWEMEWVKQNKC